MTVDVPDRQSGEAVGGALAILVLAYGTMDFLGPIAVEHLGSEPWAIGAFWSGTLFGQAGFLAVWAG